MRVLFVSANYSYYFAIDPVIRELDRRGHKVHIATGRWEKRNFPDDSLRNAQADLPNLTVHPLLKRRFLYRFTRNLREVLNYAFILNHEEARFWDVVLWGRFFPSWLWRVIGIPAAKAKLKDRAFQQILRAWEQKIPADPSIVKEIRRIAPDVVLLTPLLNPDSRETEYLRAAKSLGIPTIYAMASWDNTSTKGTFHGFPDYCLVWNKPLADEVAQLHGFPPEGIFATGTPRFSHLFNGARDEYILPRDEFCRQAGLEADKPFVLYVCSTFLLNAERQKVEESVVILEAARALKTNPRTKDMNILVRPHPLNMKYISSLADKGPSNIAVFPLNGEIPDTEEKMKRYYSSIYYSSVVMGVNTTAFLEVAALDKPCITLYIGENTETQSLPHFHHLTDGKFLETANDPVEAAALVERIVDGIDARAVQRRDFVKYFLSPCERPAVAVYADMIERIVRQKPRPISGHTRKEM